MTFCLHCACFLSFAGLSNGPIMKSAPSGSARYTIEMLPFIRYKNTKTDKKGTKEKQMGGKESEGEIHERAK